MDACLPAVLLSLNLGPSRCLGERKDACAGPPEPCPPEPYQHGPAQPAARARLLLSRALSGQPCR